MRRQDTAGFNFSSVQNYGAGYARNIYNANNNGSGEDPSLSFCLNGNPDNYTTTNNKYNFTMGAKATMGGNAGVSGFGSLKPAAPNSNNSNNIMDQKTVFVTMEELLQGKKVLYTTLDYDNQQQKAEEE